MNVGTIAWSPDYRTPKQRELEADLKAREWEEIMEEIYEVLNTTPVPPEFQVPNTTAPKRKYVRKNILKKK